MPIVFTLCPMENPLWSFIFTKAKGEEESVLDVLKHVAIFDNLGKRDLLWIKQIIHIRHYGLNEIVFAENEPGVGLYIISKGTVKIVKKDSGNREITLANLTQGQFFGELSLLDDSPRSATGIATEPSVLLGFFHPDLMELIRRKPSLGCHLLLRLAQLLGERLRKTNELIQ
jgi:CRP-like cAMP-binding protein